MDGIKRENNLFDITTKLDLNYIDDIADVLAEVGPFMILGNFGAIINIPVVQVAIGRVAGHWIVVAGTDTMTDHVWIHDPMLWAGKWMSRQRSQHWPQIWGFPMPHWLRASTKRFFALGRAHSRLPLSSARDR